MNANLELIRDLYNQIEDLKAKLEAEKEVLLNDFQSMTTEEIKAIDNKLSAEGIIAQYIFPSTSTSVDTARLNKDGLYEAYCKKVEKKDYVKLTVTK